MASADMDRDGAAVVESAAEEVEAQQQLASENEAGEPPLRFPIASSFNGEPPLVPKGAVWKGSFWMWKVSFPAGKTSSAIALSSVR